MPGHHGPVGALVTLLALVFAGLLAGTIAAHFLHPMGGNSDTAVGSGLELRSGRLAAQSFQTAVPFTLTRVALYVSDISTSDVLWVGLVGDAAGLPTGPILAQSSNDSGAPYTWVAYDLSPAVNLTAGTTFWIVANSSEANNRGYRWWNSGYDANTTGTAAQLQGGLWSLRADDFAFLLYGWSETIASLDHRAAAATALAGAETSFLLDVNVTGTDPAYNATLDYGYPSPDLTFQRDTSSGSGVSWNLTQSPGRLRYVAFQAGPGNHDFTVTFRVGSSIPAGTIETTNASLSYVDFLGQPRSVANVSASVRVLNLAIAVAGSADPPGVDPGAPVRFWISYANNAVNGTTVSDFRGAAVLPAEVTFLNASGNFSFDLPSRTVFWAVGDLAPGTAGNLSVFVVVAVGLPARFALGALLTASYADSPMTRATLLTTYPFVVVQAPVLSVELVADRAEIRSNDLLTYTIYLNNSGNGFAGSVWVNETKDRRLDFIRARSPGGEFTVTDDFVRWNLTDIPPGTTLLGLDVRAETLRPDGANIESRLTVGYTDRLGHFRETIASDSVIVSVRAPQVVVDISVDMANASNGVRLTESVVLRNTGREPAHSVYLNQTLGVHTRYVLAFWGNTTLPPLSTDGGEYSWLIPILPPGEQANVTIVLQAENDGPGDALVGLFVAGSFTDAFGREAATFGSASLELTVRGSPAWFSLSNPWFLLLLGTAALLGAAAVFEGMFGRFRIEELFLVRRDGILLVHRSRTPTTDRDADVFAAMFTVVQDFVVDSFGYRPGRQLREMSFGKLSGFIAPGQKMYLAVMHTGRIGPAARRGLMKTIRDLGLEHAAAIDAWNGKAGEIVPLATALESLLHARIGLRVGLGPYLPLPRRHRVRAAGVQSPPPK